MQEKLKSEKIAVLGIGNLLLSDEGVGIHIIRELEKMKLPENVALYDGGTSSLDALYQIGSVRKLIVVDAVQGGGPPGAVYRFAPEDVENEENACASLHQLPFLEILKAAERTGDRPAQTIIIGVEPESFDWNMELSPCIRNKMPAILEIVLKEISVS